MEIDKVIDNEETSDEEKEEEEVLHPVEMNSFDSLENESLIVGLYGNGFAFVKSSLLTLIKANKAFKIKYMTRNVKNKHAAKKLLAELYQITEGGATHLVLLTKQYLDNYFYNQLVDHIRESLKLNYKSIIIAEGVFSSRLIAKTDKERENHINKSFQIRNSFFTGSSGLNNYPFPNKIRGFGAYLLAHAEFNKIPSILLISSQDEYRIDLKSISLFEGFSQGNSLFRDKLSETYLKSNQINLTQSVFAELDSNNKLIYT